jgi:arylsulfatase
MSRKGLLAVALGAGAAAALLFGAVRLRGLRPGADAAPRNLVLVSIDTLRADHLGVYGYARATSPHVDAFARDAVRFENAYAHSSVTRFSVASLLTGFLPHETGVTEGDHLPDEVQTMAELLRARGFATAAVVSNYVLRAKRGFDQGFDVYDDHTPGSEAGGRAWPERTADATTDRALELLEQLRLSQPFFLWVHYQDPHGPYTPPAPYRERFRDPKLPPRPLPVNEGLSGIGGIPNYQRLGGERDFHFYLSQYDGEIAYMDEQFGRLSSGLRRLGLWDASIVVFTADHGESLGERNHWFAHMEYLYGELTRVPLIVRFGDGRRGVRADRVQHADLLPTVLAAFGLPAPPGLRGHDLRVAGAPEREIFAEIELPFVRGGRRTSLVRDGFRIVHNRPAGSFELYDLTADPAETRDLAGDAAHASRLAALREALLRLEAEDRLRVGAAPAPALSEEERRNLEALGYVR